jgi:tRNA threonylcarbamoyladenosine biosynthesis protein TsaB
VQILSLETSGQSGSLAAYDRDRLVAERILDPAKRSAQTLAPAIRDLLSEAGWQPAEVQVVAVVVGPGSFTGLRVGVISAKTFAYAVNARVVAINTLDVVAEQAYRTLPAQVTRLTVAIDAQRGEVFAAIYERGPDNAWSLLLPAAIMTQTEWLATLGPGSAASGLALEKLAEHVSAGTFIVPQEQWMPQAVTVGQLAARRVASGEFDDVWQLAPLYMRRSAAEEKFDAVK